MHQRFRMFRNTLRAASAAMALALASAASAAWGAASAAADEPYHVVHGWPHLPPDFALGQVSGVAVDSHNHVFVFHRAENSWATDKTKVIPSATVMCFDGSTGKLLSSWGQNRFLLPHGLRVDSHDHVWVTDLGLQQVLEFSHDGELLRTLGTERSAGLDGSHFNRPTDVGFAPDGSILVSDGYGNSRIAKFAANGHFLLDWGRKGNGPGEFDTPHGVVVDTQGHVYVADRGNARIQVFTLNGEFIRSWSSTELGRPWALTLGSDNRLYVVDGGDAIADQPARGQQQILKLDLSGKILAHWSRFGNYDGQIYWGHDIAVGKDGAVYVGDVLHGMRVQKFVQR